MVHNGTLKALFDYEVILLKVDYFNPDFSGKWLVEFAHETIAEIIRIQHLSIYTYFNYTFKGKLEQ